jgi:hypothetical protein
MSEMRYIPLIERNIMASNFGLGVSCLLIFRRPIMSYYSDVCSLLGGARPHSIRQLGLIYYFILLSLL